MLTRFSAHSCGSISCLTSLEKNIKKKPTSALGEVGLSEVLALQLLLSHPSLWLFDP